MDYKTKMGDDQGKLTERLRVRVSPELLKALKKGAAKQHRRLSDYIRLTLEGAKR